MEERIRNRLERLERQIAELEAEAALQRLWSEKRQRLDTTIKRLKEEKKMLEDLLGE